ncbi:hypothetical protein ABZ946_28785 [Streptomyces sp. NPDC046324]|uniref:hypothetical protein n=1 Tax=Streptomyces sp. NPDC046324 TaxID=3154915 RepID=UPI003410CC34
MVIVRRKRGVAALGGAVALALALAGCGGDGGDGKAASAPSTANVTSVPPTSAADPQAAEKTAVLAAYNAMTEQEAKAYAKADTNGTQLEKYATLDALGQIRVAVARMKEAGTVVRGEVGHDAKVTALDMDTKTPKATLSDCVDLSNYQTWDIRAKKAIPLPSNQPLRYVATATAEKWPTGWIVTSVNFQGGPTC